jgi:hypothetical protein
MNSHQTKSQNPLKNIPKNNIMIGGDLLEVHLSAVQQARYQVLAKCH